MKICGVEWCQKEALRVGKYYAKRCSMHRVEWYRHYKIFTQEERVERKKPLLCSVDGCDGKYWSLGFCTKHYQRMKRHGIFENKRPNWGLGRTTIRGYVMIYYPEFYEANKRGYVAEHRMVMARHLHRRLLPTEIIHHEDGDRSNNQISNLALFEGVGEHTKYHWAKKREMVKKGIIAKGLEKKEKEVENADRCEKM